MVKVNNNSREMEVNKYKTKFKMMFEKFYKNKFVLDDYYADNLLKHLEGRTDTNVVKVLDTPFFSDLILHALENLDKVSNSVKSFIMEIITILLKNELQFSKVNRMHGFHVMAAKIGTSSGANITDTRFHLAGIKAMTAETYHYTGTMWLVEHELWRIMLYTGIHKKPVKIQNAAYEFISRIVCKLIEFEEEEALIQVLGYLVEPIKMNGYGQYKEMDEEKEREIGDQLVPFLKAIQRILIDAVKENAPGNKAVQLLFRYLPLEPPCRLIADVTRNNDLMCLIDDVLFRMSYALVLDHSVEAQAEAQIASEIIIVYYNNLNLLLGKRMLLVMVDFVVNCTIFWSKLDQEAVSPYFERYGRQYDIRMQFLVQLMTPIMSYATIKSNDAEPLKAALQDYAITMSKIVSEHVTILAYTFRNLIMMMSSDGTEEPALLIINILRKVFNLKGHLNIQQAGLLYQSLFFLLQAHIISDGSGGLVLNDNPLKTQSDVKLLSMALELIKMLLNEHNINWFETVEIICLQTILMNLLKQNILPTKLLIQVLDLIDLSIQRFLSPDMALLIESKAGSSLNEIIRIMKQFIQHEEWEVRDSALQMLLSCVDVAFVKYIPIQKLLLQSDLLSLAVHASEHDSEFYVQTTALKCLTAATKIESIWNNVLVSRPDIYVHLINILRTNSEDIVRAEAANVLTEAFMNQRMSLQLKHNLYQVMADAAVKDLHWEVQLSALNFWKQTIKDEMSNRGMIDGKFPSVTFSREKRKIVVLNEKEILLQLTAMLKNLASIGCLTVLHTCLNEEFNTDILEHAYNITKDLVKVLNEYKYGEINGDKAIEYTKSRELIPRHEMELSLNLAMDLTITSRPVINDLIEREQVIENIVNMNFTDLIVDFKREDIETELSENCDMTAPRNLIGPVEFLNNYRSNDYASVIENKRKWNSGNNLDALLDEIISIDGSLAIEEGYK